MRNIYALGDSIMEGYGNHLVGIADTLHNMYGYRIMSDVSKSGATLTKTKTLPMYTICTKQYDLICSELKKKGFDKETIIIVDGGGNDAKLLAENTIQGIPTDITLDSIQFFTGALLSELAKKVSGRGYQVPIYFILPNVQNPAFASNPIRHDINYQFIWRQLRTVLDEADNGVKLVNLNELLDYKTDMADMVHPNASGYKKIAEYINAH